jgi:hypothetical protein
MNETPFMPKATAVWLVENTTLTFRQIAEFCNLHELEIKGIADGDVAKGIKAYNPILAGQLSRDEIEKSKKEKNQNTLHFLRGKTDPMQYFGCVKMHLSYPMVKFQNLLEVQRVLFL